MIVSLILFIIYKGYRYIKKLYIDQEITIKSVAGPIVLYSSLLGLYFLNKGFKKRTIRSIYLDKGGEKLKFILFGGKQNNPNILETGVKNVFSITSKRNNIHEILIAIDGKKDFIQLFAYKNASYDRKLLMNMCHPFVNKIVF